jgi:hypothetical protein
VKASRAQTHRTGSFSMGLSDYNTESFTAAHSGSHVWRVPCSRHIKDLFCTFWKKKCIIATTIFFLFIPNSPYFFCGSQQSLTYFNHSFPCFYNNLLDGKLWLWFNFSDTFFYFPWKTGKWELRNPDLSCIYNIFHLQVTFIHIFRCQ